MSGDPNEGQWFHQCLPWLWSEETPRTFWSVCRFDLILVVPSMLTSITAPLAFISMHSYWLPNVCASTSVSFVVLMYRHCLLKKKQMYIDITTVFIICCSIDMSKDYFIQVWHGPLWFAISDFGVYCLFL